MDYEKKYKEALERAKQFSETPYLEDSKGIVEYIFPELQESEDERIRKSLIDMLKNDEKCYLKEIAWLEKQGEQKHTAEEVLIKAGLKPYKDGDQWCVLLGDNIQEGICGFGNTIEDALYAFLKDLIASQGEQKPNTDSLLTWSEEDEKIYQSIMDDTVQENQLDSKQIDWLKSLKDRYTEAER